MSALHRKTKRHDLPHGSPQVYFTGCPEDHPLYFPQLSETILELVECSIWFTDAEPEDPDRHLEDLGFMQLFVFPVTGRLLGSPNRTMDMELPFALERHIPLLPVMVETGLDELYSKRLKGIHYLRLYDGGPGKPDFRTLLKKYLASVLVDDYWRGLIRENFDARIFLSYRKKDRALALKLMRLFHRNEACQNTALWFDDFLTPGEDYNRNIRAALEESGLFLMAVTPNLVSERNYIMDTEYPLASQLGKAVLPVQLLPTEAALLERFYPGIPQAVDSGSEKELDDRALQLLGLDPRSRPAPGPMQRYLTGLAYLSGLDVETDSEKALTLISSAAKDGLPASAAKLVEMYQYGNGVPRSPTQALFWQEQLIRLHLDAYRREPSDDRLEACCISLSTAGDLCRDGEMYEAARKFYSRVFSLVDRASPENEARFLPMKGAAVLGVGAMDKLLGRSQRAQRSLQRALMLGRQLLSLGESAEALSLCSSAHNLLGHTLREAGDTHAGALHLEQHLQFSKKLAMRSDAVSAFHALLFDYKMLGSTFQLEGDTDSALRCYEAAAALCRRLTEEADSMENLREYADCLRLLGDILHDSGAKADAESKLAEALEIYEKLAKLYKAPEDLHGLINCQLSLAGFYSLDGKDAQALHLCTRAYSLSRELLGSRDSEENLLVHGRCCYALAGADRGQECIYLKETEQVYERLCSLRPEKAYYSYMLNFYRKLLNIKSGSP